jgi:hypothetical protein
MELAEIVQDIGSAIKRIDSRRPRAAQLLETMREILGS